MKEKLANFYTLLPGVLFVAWMSGLWLVSSLPGNEVRLPPFPHADKIVHCAFFAIGGFLLAWFLQRLCGWTGWRLILIVTLAMAVIGAGDEIHQLFTPGRMGSDWGDWLADVAGGLAGAWTFLMIYAVATRIPPTAAPTGN